jgi:hypothetical protein
MNPLDFNIGFVVGFVCFGLVSILYYKIRFGDNNRR